MVYRALQLDLERMVALKVIAPELLDDDDVRKRFLTEARAAASVDHPNVIPVHTAGEDNGIAFIAMRFVAGDDLRSLVRHGGALDPAEAADYVAQAAAALDAIHRAGFVHRDVKPANLLVDQSGHVYLTDFGLAKTVLTHSGGTRTGQWVGTLDYVSPEQIRGGRIDARADVYALGGVLHYALTGRVPFEREGDEAKLWAQLSAPPPVPSALQPGLPAQFDVAVARAMAKDANERYPSAGDLGRAARAAAAGRLPTEPERMVARGAAAPGEAPTEPGLAAEASTRTAARVATQRPRRRVGRLVGAAAVLATVIAAAAMLLLRDEAPSVADAPTPTPSPSPTRTVEEDLAPTYPRAERTITDVSDQPVGIALGGGDLWVSGTRSRYLTRVSATTGRERANHPDVGPSVVAIVAYKNAVYVATSREHQVVRLDSRTGNELSRITLPVTPGRLSVDRHGIWVSEQALAGEPGTLLRYDLETGQELQRIEVREGIGGLLAADNHVWVVKHSTNRLARLEPGSSQLVDWTDLNAPARTMRYGGGSLWVVLDGEDTVVRVDAGGRDKLSGAAGRSPTQAVLAGDLLFVASRDDHTVVVLDPETMVEAHPPIRVGYNPRAMVADDRSVWVTGSSDNTLTQIRYR